jgi:hypothetical protein
MLMHGYAACDECGAPMELERDVLIKTRHGMHFCGADCARRYRDEVVVPKRRAWFDAQLPAGWERLGSAALYEF